MKMDEYEKKAKAFLKKTDTEFKAEFLRYGKHFTDDKVERDIYEITLKRGEREYKFNFGQSINVSGHYTFFGSEGRKKIHLKKNIKGLLIKRYDGKMLNRGNSERNENFKEPNAYDVLSCLQKNEVGSFEDFCGDFGYDTDSRKAEQTYNTVVDEYKNVAMLWSEKELEELREIE